ncbi:glycoside hydrolase family 3 C-terminal domain-containing protein [bacterium]|nr:glycoside hydrolase family 3 C-terminal domain-containing protein [bacterium]
MRNTKHGEGMIVKKKYSVLLLPIMVVLATHFYSCFKSNEAITNRKLTWSESDITLTSSEIKANSLATAVHVAGEGIVLLKNDNGSLPLKADGGVIKVNVFGTSSLDPEFAGGGGANISLPCIGFYEALERAGIAYNQELYQAYSDWYEQYRNETPYAGGIVGDEGAAIWDLTSAGALNAEWNLTTDLYNADGSLRIARMDETILERAEAYSDAAIVFLHRAGSEGGDIGISDLTIVEAEAALLEYVTANYDNVIVIFNTCNLMNMSWLDGVGEDQVISYGSYSYGGSVRRGFGGRRDVSEDTTPRTVITYDEPHTYQIGECHSAMVIWSPGEVGMTAVAEVLKGDVNPSGRLIDVIVKDLSTNPTYENFGNYTYDDGSGYTYVTYEEGIYVGYQYYETFAPEEVLYGFGHGLSYSDFDWEIVDYKLGTNGTGENTVEVSVKVTNNGPYAGKDIVELYYSQPFYNDGVYAVEKSLINLGAFEKTSLLDVGESETVKLVLNVRDMASYSIVSECYVLEGGRCVIEIATDSKNARGLFDAASDMIITLSIASEEESDMYLGQGDFRNPEVDPNCIQYDPIEYNGKSMFAIRYTSDEVTGTKYKNLFEDCIGEKEVNGVYMARYDVNGVPTVKEGTYPQSPDADDYFTSAIHYNDNYDTYSDLTYWADGLDDLKEVVGEEKYEELIQEVPQGVVYRDEDGNIDHYTIQEMFADIKSGMDEDACWDKFLDQLSFYEMLHVNDGCGFQFPALEQVGVYWSWGRDGAAQVGPPQRVGGFGGQSPRRDTSYIATGFPSGTCMCATWNTDMAYAMGHAQGYEAYLFGHSALYAPGLNLHRNQSCGRNFEYMSEDVYLGGNMISQLCYGMQNPGGLCAGVKHFMLNNQEMNRRAVHTYLSEQAVRETVGEAWENCFKLGGAMGIMGAFNSIGYRWVGCSYALNTALLRDEWGYRGYIVSDLGAIRDPGGGYFSWVTCLISGHDSLEETMNWMREYVQDVINYYKRGGDYANILLHSVRANTRHIFSAWGISNGYIEDVEAAIANLEAGGYDFDSVTPEEHGYTDIGWYPLVIVGEGTSNDNTGSLAIPIEIDGNNGLSAATFMVTSAIPIADVIDTKGEKLTYESTYDSSADLYTYTIAFQETNPKIADYDLFYLVYDADAASGVRKDEIGLSYANALDRIGHSTSLYVGERPDNSQTGSGGDQRGGFGGG